MLSGGIMWTGDRQVTDCVMVVRLVNSYIATRVQGRKKTFISENLATDFKVAAAAAKAFAEEHVITYKEGLHEPDRPLITVIKDGDTWFPAELHPDRVRLLTKLGPVELGGTQEVAMNLARSIAISKRADFLPLIGISLAK